MADFLPSARVPFETHNLLAHQEWIRFLSDIFYKIQAGMLMLVSIFYPLWFYHFVQGKGAV